MVFAYAHSPMRRTGWIDLFKPKQYKKIEGLFEAVVGYQEKKAKGELTEFGKAPSLRGPPSPERGANRWPFDPEDPMTSWDDEDSDVEDPVVKVKPESEDHFYDINYRNMIKVALRYREHHDIKSTELADVLAQMCQNGWAFCKQIQKQGILDTYFTEFTAQCEGKSSYTKEMISLMRRPVRKRARLALAAEADEAVAEASPLEQEASPSDAASPSGLEAAAATAAKAASAALAARATLAVRAAWGGQ
jgi:hypothetical protein